MKVVIIEDEVTAFRGLSGMLEKLDREIEVIANLTTVKDSIDWLGKNLHPDLLFLDIQLTDGLSFEIFKEIECLSPVIFCTAYNQYAIEAFKLNSIDYLLKPYQLEDLKKAFDKLQVLSNRTQQIDYEKLAGTIQARHNYKERFMVSSGKKFYQVSEDKIAYFYTKDRVNFLVTQDNKQYVIDEFLDEMERNLNPNKFFRVNRQFIVAIDSIQSVLNDYGKFYLELNPSSTEDVYVSRSRLAEFKSWLGE